MKHDHDFEVLAKVPWCRRCWVCSYLQVKLPTDTAWRTATPRERDRARRMNGDTWKPAAFLPQGLSRYGHPRVRRIG